jgi:hypothetical protein
LSVNWVEYFQTPTLQEAVPLLRDIFVKKGRKVGPTSKFALLNVELDAQDDDPSHSLVKGYDEALNDQVAEQLAKVILAAYPVNP